MVFDNGYIEIDPEQCGYSTFLGMDIITSDNIYIVGLYCKSDACLYIVGTAIPEAEKRGRRDAAEGGDEDEDEY